MKPRKKSRARGRGFIIALSNSRKIIKIKIVIKLLAQLCHYKKTKKYY